MPQCYAGRGMSAMRPATRLRHFPRESLIAICFFGGVSIVKVEIEGQQGEATLTTRSEPHNRRAIHAEPEVNPGSGWGLDADGHGPDMTTGAAAAVARS